MSYGPANLVGLAVRLYLSLFRMGDNLDRLLALVGQDSRGAVVIANAMDDAPSDVRRAGVERELAALIGLGLDAAELDLCGYFGPRQLLRRDLAGTGVAWLRGGNVFMLRVQRRVVRAVAEPAGARAR